MNKKRSVVLPLKQLFTISNSSTVLRALRVSE